MSRNKKGNFSIHIFRFPSIFNLNIQLSVVITFWKFDEAEVLGIQAAGNGLNLLFFHHCVDDLLIAFITKFSLSYFLSVFESYMDNSYFWVLNCSKSSNRGL